MSELLKINKTDNTICIGGATAESSDTIAIPEDWFISGLFPVGAIYITVDNLEGYTDDLPHSPARFFGGTWERFANGRVLVCTDGVWNSSTHEMDGTYKTFDDDSVVDFREKELEGGLNAVTLTVNTIPRHRHTYGQVASSAKSSGEQPRPMSYSTSYSSHYNSYATGLTNPTPHNNVQDYITAYIWRRIA